MQRALQAGDLGRSNSTNASRLEAVLLSARHLARRSQDLGGPETGLDRVQDRDRHGSGTTGPGGVREVGRLNGLVRRQGAKDHRAELNGPQNRLGSGKLGGARSVRSRRLAGRSRASPRLSAVLAKSREPAVLPGNLQADPLANDPKAGVSVTSPQVGAGLARSRHGRSRENDHQAVLAERPGGATVRRSSGSSSRAHRQRATSMNR